MTIVLVVPPFSLPDSSTVRPASTFGAAGACMGAETGAGRCARGISAFCAACGGSSFCWKGFSCSSLPAFFLSFFPPKRPNRPPLFFSGFFSAFLFSFCGFSFLGWTSAKGLPLCAKGLSCAGSGTTGSRASAGHTASPGSDVFPRIAGSPPAPAPGSFP